MPTSSVRAGLKDADAIAGSASGRCAWTGVRRDRGAAAAGRLAGPGAQQEASRADTHLVAADPAAARCRQALSVVVHSCVRVAALVDVGANGLWAKRALSGGGLHARELVRVEATCRPPARIGQVPQARRSERHVRKIRSCSPSTCCPSILLRSASGRCVMPRPVTTPGVSRWLKRSRCRGRPWTGGMRKPAGRPADSCCRRVPDPTSGS